LVGLYQHAVVPGTKTRDATPMPAFLDRTLNRTREAPDFHPANYQQTMRDLYRLLAGVDIAVGRITDAVRELGVADNTVILYTSDHGSFYGEHGFGGKWLMYEEAIRTPTILFDPRLPVELRGTTCQQMVLNIDLCPTLLDLAGVRIPVSVQGSSLAPLAYGQDPPWRSEWFYEHPFNDHDFIAPSEGIRTQRWKYVRYVDSWPLCEQLFDLEADPREERNLVDALDYRETLKSLRARWEIWGDQLSNWSGEERWSDPPVDAMTA
jgi:arylsulfatase A-like enzyme